MNGSLLYNYILVNRFFRRRVGIISSLNRHIVELLGLNLYPLFVFINCLVLIDIIDNTLSIALVSTKQLINTKNRHRLSPNNSTVCLLKELIIPILHLKKRLTNIQLYSKLPFTL